MPFSDSALISSSAANIPSAIGRSNALPSFFISAGARFTVILFDGNVRFEFFSAAITLSLDSLTAESGNPTIKKLNRKYLNKDSATDVLSFPINEKAADSKFYLGDIIISVPYARKQSQANKHSLERELKKLTVHGFLHLLGFEHFKGMEEEEDKIHNIILGDNDGS